MFEMQPRAIEAVPTSDTPQRRPLGRPQSPQIKSFFCAFGPTNPELFSSSHLGNLSGNPQPAQFKSYFSICDVMSRASGLVDPTSITQQSEQQASGSGDLSPAELEPNHTGIPTRLKTQMEASSGLSLSDVQVHYNSDSPAQLQALAYTQANQVYIGPGQEKHLPHELGHVIQQKQGLVRATRTLNGLPLNDNSHLEDEADRLGTRVSSQPASSLIQRRAMPGVIQRQVFCEQLPSPYGPKPFPISGSNLSMKIYLLDKARKHGPQFIVKQWRGRGPDGRWLPPAVRGRQLPKDNHEKLSNDEGNFAIGVAKKKGSGFGETSKGSRLQKADRVKKYAYSQANDAKNFADDYTSTSTRQKDSMTNKMVFKPTAPLSITNAPHIGSESQELVHTELKILESFYALATQLQSGGGYDIYLYSERDPCDTCSQIINAFEAHTHVDLYIYYSFNHPHSGHYRINWQQPGTTSGSLAASSAAVTSSATSGTATAESVSYSSSSSQPAHLLTSAVPEMESAEDFSSPTTSSQTTSSAASEKETDEALTQAPLAIPSSTSWMESDTTYYWQDISAQVINYFKTQYEPFANLPVEQIGDRLEMAAVLSSNPTMFNGTRAYRISDWITLLSGLLKDDNE